MVRIGPSLFVLGFILVALGAAMLLTAAFDLWVNEGAAGSFAASAFLTLFIGGSLAIANRAERIEFDQRQAYVLTVMAWLGASAVSAVPLVLSLGITYTDAFFEAMSGLTTTGSTVLAGLDTMPRAVLLWRALLQWMGGLGIIVMAIAILPFLRVGGMQLFKSESTDKSEKVMPRPGQFAQAIGIIYLVLTGVCAVAYVLAGMSGFDATTHAMTTIATGGFANYDASFAAFGSQAVLWIAVVFMVLGSLPFVLYVRMWQRQWLAVIRDGQVLTFLGILFLAIVSVIAVRVTSSDVPLGEAITVSAFNLTSIMTGTGYAAGDYTAWGTFPFMVGFLLKFLGGCSGSTTGGIKIFRLQIIYIALRMQIQRTIHPHAVLHRQYNAVRLSDDVIASVLVFVAIYLVTVIAVALGLAALGADFVTALSGAATSVSNVGPGLGPQIGPDGNFAGLSDAQTWLLSAAMLLGRLELMTVFVLLTTTFWRK